jgi:hypothetical protein
VYSVDEALSQLRLQPLVDTLHRTISEATIHGFAEAAYESLTRELAVEAKDGSARRTANKERAEVAVTEADSPMPDEGVSEFVASVRTFAAMATYLAQLGGMQNDAAAKRPAWISALAETAEAATSVRESISGTAIAAASVRLPWLVMKFPEALQTAARSVLPSTDVRIPAAQTWAPAMAWMALRALPSPAAALGIYDVLRLRHALAETFSAVGVQGEQAWRAAAQVRTLLLMNLHGSCSTAVRSAEFWNDGDVRWLTGIRQAVEEPEYFEKESFEAFVCWLQLPALIAGGEGSVVHTKAAHDVTAIAANLAYAAKVAGYDVRRFLDVLHTGDLKKRHQPEMVDLNIAGE